MGAVKICIYNYERKVCDFTELCKKYKSYAGEISYTHNNIKYDCNKLFMSVAHTGSSDLKAEFKLHASITV